MILLKTSAEETLLTMREVLHSPRREEKERGGAGNEGIRPVRLVGLVRLVEDNGKSNATARLH